MISPAPRAAKGLERFKGPSLPSHCELSGQQLQWEVDFPPLTSSLSWSSACQNIHYSSTPTGRPYYLNVTIRCVGDDRALNSPGLTTVTSYTPGFLIIFAGILASSSVLLTYRVSNSVPLRATR